MPHIIIETSIEIKNGKELLKKLHDLLPAIGPFTKTGIKSRIHYCKDFHVADEDHTDFLHCNIKILPGRDIETKKNLTENVLKLIIEELNNKKTKTSYSVEVTDIEKESYSKETI